MSNPEQITAERLAKAAEALVVFRGIAKNDEKELLEQAIVLENLVKEALASAKLIRTSIEQKNISRQFAKQKKAREK